MEDRDGMNAAGHLPTRAQYWHEMDNNLKLETLARAVEAQDWFIRELESVAIRLSVHRHENGEPVIPLNTPTYDAPYSLRNPLNRERTNGSPQY